jgi:arylsulfatase A-like enzyme
MKRAVQQLTLAVASMAICSVPAIAQQQPQPAPAAPVNQARPKYNVLFLISDDLRAECTTYGGQAKTPNVDKIAQEGVRFDRAYCQYALCNPSRSSLLTGRYPITTNVMGNRDNWRTIHPDWVSLPQMFKDNGYASLRAGKVFHGIVSLDDPKAWTEGYGTQEGSGGAGGRNMVIPPQDVPPQPPDVLPPLAGDLNQRATSDRIVVLDGNGEGNPDYNVAEKAIGYLRKYKDQPFFVACGFSKPHSPPAAPQRFFDLYNLDDIKLPPDFAPWPTVTPGFPKASLRMLNADLFIGRGASQYEAKEVTRAYFASASWMDWNLGRVMTELQNLGLRDKTIIVFWGDHGYHLGEKGKWSKAGSVWELGSRVPFIISVPGAKGNGTPSPRVVEMIDLYPTLGELCGLPVEKGVEGRSLAPLLEDPRREWNHPAFTVWSEDGKHLTRTAVRTEKYRYAEFEYGQSGAMLTDPENDPYETKNLVDDPKYADVKAQLAPLVREFMSRPGAKPAGE